MHTLRLVIILTLVLIVNLPQSFAAFDSAEFNKTKSALKIIRIMPAGKDVPAKRQIIFKFNQPVVPIGRMERKRSEIPISINPAVKCEWRWLNTSSLACQLSNKTKLKYATRYEVIVRPGMKTRTGIRMSQTHKHVFITQRPKARYAYHVTWRSPVLPVLRVYFNQPVSKDSISKSLYFRSGHKNIAINVRPYYKKRKSRFSNYWLVTPVRPLEPSATVKLMVKPGLVSQRGPMSGVQRKVITTLNTFPAFKFTGLSCQNTVGKEIKVTTASNPLTEKCSPDHQIRLLFSAPFAINTIANNMTMSPDTKTWQNIRKGWLKKNYRYHFSPHRSHSKNQQYALHLNSAINANSSYGIKIDHQPIRDIFGRSLKNGVNVKFLTDHFNPRIRMPQRVSILEQGVDPLLFIKTLNIDNLLLRYSRFTAGTVQHSLTHSLVPENVKDKYVATQMNLEKMLNAQSGIVIGTIKTTPSLALSSDRFHYLSQVTPWHAHMKFGSFNSLLWITNLKTGSPVDNARVEIIKGNLLKPSTHDKVIAEGTSNSDGLVTLPGLKTLDPTLSSYSNSYYHALMYAKIIKGTSITLLPFSRDFRNSYYQVANNGGQENIRRFPSYTKSWGFTAQGVYKPGDKIDFKIFIRDQNNLGFIPAAKATYSLQILDPQGSKVYKKEKIKISEFGTFSDSLKTFKSSKSGLYQFRLKVDADGHSTTLTPMQVLVTDFTPAPFRVNASLDKKLYQSGDTLKVTTKSQLHAGGPYANGATRVTTMLLHQALSPDTPKTRGFTFSSPHFYRKNINQIKTKGNAKGLNVHAYTLNSPVIYAKLVTESAVKDERGKYVSTQTSAIFAGRDRYAGLKIKSWTLKQDKATNILALIIDPQGKLQSDQAFDLTIKFRHTSIQRKKNSDGILITKYRRKWITVTNQKLVSADERKSIPFTPSKAGYYQFVVSVKDSQGKRHQSTLYRWASGKGRVYWKPKPGFKLEITADKKTYQVGDQARFMIRNPYPGAKALVTVERKGIISQWVKTFTNNIEILNIPVKPEYLPGFYVSVVVMAPRRTDKDKKNSLAPGFRIGYSKILVKDSYKELTIKVSPQKKTYKPRDTVKVDINVKTRQGKTPATELAVVVLDESVFDLISQGKAYFDPYTGLYKLDGLAVANFNLLKKLIAHKKKMKKLLRRNKAKISRRKELSKKSLPMAMMSTADRGRQFEAPASEESDNDATGTTPKVTVRNIFKYLSYWNGTIRPDAKGNASVKFKAPDNLTGWRVLVIAVDKSQLMGLGQGQFTVNLPLELRPALPNQVIEGDAFTARFSIMNRSNKERKVQLVISAAGNIKGKKKSKTLTIIAPPFKRITAGIEVQASTFGRMTFTAKAVSGKLADATRVSLNIHRKKSLEVAANYGTSTSATVSETIKLPNKIRKDVGKLAVTVSTSILGHLQSAFTYLQHYPYSCWEQKLTKGVMASHYQQLKPWLPQSSHWKKSKSLPQRTLLMAAAHQAPNGGMVYYIPKNSHVSPYLSAYTAIAFNWLRSHGHTIPAHTEKRLHQYLLKLIRGRRFPRYYNKGMSSTIRAIALAALAEHGKITRKEILVYMPHVQSMSLFGKAHFLRALVHTKNTSAAQRKVMNIIQSKANETGGKYLYSERINANFRHLLYSSTRSQCAILSSMLAYETKEKNRSTDIPFKLLRAITAERKRSGRWNNTQDNMFCMSALIDYSKVYEKQPPDMVLTLLVNQSKMGSARLKGFRAKPQVISKPMNKLGPVNKSVKLTLNRQGKGRYYFNTQLHYSLKKLRKNAVNAGIVIRREYSVERNKQWILLKSPMKIKRGELVRVDLYLDLAAARNFVVVDDAIPGGLEAVNTQLATASKVDARKAKMRYARGSYWYKHHGWRGYGYSHWSFYHRELLHHAARFYSEYLPAGKYHLSYVAQAIAPGTFTVLPTHSEEMYNPDTYGKSKPGVLIITDAP